MNKIEYEKQLKVLTAAQKRLEKKKLALREKEKELAAQELEAFSQLDLTCVSNCYGRGCGEIFQPRETVYIQTYWYETPSGCTGGDQWYRSEGQFDCPHCGHRNREHDHPVVNHNKRFAFKGQVESHDENGDPPRVGVQSTRSYR